MTTRSRFPCYYKGMKNNIVKYGVLNALGTLAYIVLIASAMFNGEKVFGHVEDTVLMPIVMLSLLVFSVAFVGLLLFGRPILWYWDGKKQEAISLITHTLGTFFVIILIALGILLATK